MGTTATVSAIFLAGQLSTAPAFTLIAFVVRSRVASYLQEKEKKRKIKTGKVQYLK